MKMAEDVTQGEQNAAEAAPVPRGIPWGKIGTWAVVLGLLALVALKLVQVQQGPIGVGAKVPDFTLSTFQGEEIAVSSLRGDLVVVNFWASWCKPCEGEARELEQAYQLSKDRGVTFLGVDYVDTEREARAYLERFGITYPNGPDLGTRVSQAFRIRGVPETYIISREGRLVKVKIGPYVSLDEIMADVEAVLAQ